MNHMLKIETYTLGPLDTNCYLVWDETDSLLPTLIIDPADAGDFLSDEILAKKLNPQAILLTHGHIDHLMGATELALNFNIPIYVHPKDQFLVDRAVSSAKHWFGLQILPLPPTKALDPNKNIELGQHRISMVETPGHTPGSVTFYTTSSEKRDKNSDTDEIEDNYTYAWVGDVIFENGYGRTDFSYANPMQLNRSLDTLKNTLPDTTYILPGHGNAFSWAGRI
jgi:hydroxyacylglutathione hydrolase